MTINWKHNHRSLFDASTIPKFRQESPFLHSSITTLCYFVRLSADFMFCKSVGLKRIRPDSGNTEKCRLLKHAIPRPWQLKIRSQASQFILKIILKKIDCQVIKKGAWTLRMQYFDLRHRLFTHTCRHKEFIKNLCLNLFRGIGLLHQGCATTL